MYAVQCGVYEVYKEPRPEIKHIMINFEHCNFPMELDDDDEINEIEEFEKYNGNRISINAYGIHKDIKNIVTIL